MARFDKDMSIFVLCLLLVGVLSTDRSDYILEVFTDCGSNENGAASITIVTDLPTKVFAYCSNGEFEFSYASDNSVHLNLTARYRHQGSGGCVFYQRAYTRTYVLYVKALISEEFSDVRKHQEQSIITCSFDTHANQSSASHDIVDSYLAPLEIQANMGPISSSGITLTVRDILGQPILSDRPLPLRKTVQLLAVSDGTGGEVGIKTVSCDLLGVNDGSRYPFLRAGCGDGLVLSKQAGFYTRGLTAQSYFFSTFNVARDKVVKFACNFTMCNESCDGPSCQNERHVRQAEQQEQQQADHSLYLESADYYIVQDGLPPHDTLHDMLVKLSSKDELLPPTVLVLTSMHIKLLMTIGTFMALVAIGLPVFICIFGVRNNRISPVV